MFLVPDGFSIGDYDSTSDCDILCGSVFTSTFTKQERFAYSRCRIMIVRNIRIVPAKNQSKITDRSKRLTSVQIRPFSAKGAHWY
ncbi:unnamed protein product [Nesidiocoris tenuis]|uniref:Uncharacterized protein n=1 Tax=Nesidiocoris tenuis TaxID=355587 RepID=A0A6H5FVS2_9HEMI|nr:unnamed protein product [Nesidiocoris tenuis]